MNYIFNPSVSLCETESDTPAVEYHVWCEQCRSGCCQNNLFHTSTVASQEQVQKKMIY